eukprot:PITA_35309
MVEYDSIVRNCVWDVVPRPEDKSVVSSRWLYKVKQAANGSVEKHKASFVARGFSQVKGIDYDETFSPLERYSSIRSMLALSAQMGWKIHQVDVKTAFLNGKIEEEVYIEPPEGFETFDRDDQLIKSCKEDLAREFEMKDMGLMHYFLGMEVWQEDGEVFVSQGKYANEILRRFHMEKCKPMQTPLAGNWRKEDATSSELSQAMVHPTKLFWKATKHVLRYLRGTSQYGLWYKRKKRVELQGFIAADWRSVALSSAEAEYMAASQAACEAIWMRKILVGLFGQRMDPTVIYCNNRSCIKLSENRVFHDRSKHIDIRYHHLRDCVVKRIMLLLYVSTEE